VESEPNAGPGETVWDERGDAQGYDPPPVPSERVPPPQDQPLPAAGRGIHPRAAALIEVIACSGLPTQLAIAGVLALAGIAPYDSHGRLSPAYVFALPLADAVVLLTLITGFLHLHGESLSDLLGRRSVVLEGLVGILHIPLVFLLAVSVMLTVRVVLPSLQDVERNPFESLVSSPSSAWVFVVVAVIGGGVREEIQRAFILHRFSQHLGGAAFGLVLFSIVFGLGHSLQGTDVALTTGALGLFWGVVYLRRRSVVAPMVSHSGFNSAEIFRFALFGS
jgi:membrane protease YdiL (CAAX protease family)